MQLASDYLDDTFIVISGDALCDFGQQARQGPTGEGLCGDLALKSVENPLEFGIVVTDSDGQVERFSKNRAGRVFLDTINTACT